MPTMSAPAAKAFSEPVSTMTPMPSSASKACQSLAKFDHQRIVQGVELLRPVQADQPDPLAGLGEDRFVGFLHASSSFRLRNRWLDLAASMASGPSAPSHLVDVAASAARRIARLASARRPSCHDRGLLVAAGHGRRFDPSGDRSEARGRGSTARWWRCAPRGALLANCDRVIACGRTRHRYGLPTSWPQPAATSSWCRPGRRGHGPQHRLRCAAGRRTTD